MPEPTIETGRSTRRGYPYNYGENELTFDVEAYHVGDEADTGTPNGEDRELELFRLGEWETVTIEASIEIDEPTVDYVFPEAERTGDTRPQGALVVVLDCEATQDRHVVERRPLELECSFSFTLERGDYRGNVELTAAIVRTSPSDEGLPYAPLAQLRVADSETWTIHVDEPTERGSGFPTSYLDFGESGIPTDVVHSLNENPADPRILVNEDIEPLVDVLESGGHVGFRPRLRDVLRREIVTMAWIQLVWYTWATIAETGRCEYEWQRGVVDELSDYLFEEDLDREEAIDEFGSRLDEASEIRGFVRELNRAVQRYVDQRDHIETFIEEEAP